MFPRLLPLTQLPQATPLPLVLIHIPNGAPAVPAECNTDPLFLRLLPDVAGELQTLIRAAAMSHRSPPPPLPMLQPLSALTLFPTGAPAVPVACNIGAWFPNRRAAASTHPIIFPEPALIQLPADQWPLSIAAQAVRPGAVAGKTAIRSGLAALLQAVRPPLGMKKILALLQAPVLPQAPLPQRLRLSQLLKPPAASTNALPGGIAPPLVIRKECAKNRPELLVWPAVKKELVFIADRLQMLPRPLQPPLLSALCNVPDGASAVRPG